MLIGSLPVHSRICTGMGISFQSLVNAMSAGGFAFRSINTTPLPESEVVGRFSLLHILEKLWVVLNIWFRMPWYKHVYTVISSSVPGFCKDFLIIWPAWLLGKRVVLHLNGGGYKDFFYNQPLTFRVVIERTLRKASLIIVLDDLLREQFDFVKHHEHKLRVVPNGMSADLSPDELPRRSSPRELGELRILFLSNLMPSKGYKDLLHALGILRQRGIPFRCDFCGQFLQAVAENQSFSPEYLRREFYDNLRVLDLEKRVVFHGTLLGREKQQILERAHVFVLPTYYPWEGQPVSIIEALAFGLPVIATQHKAIPGQVIHGYNGYLVQKQAPLQIANSLQHLQKEPLVWERMSNNAVQLFQQRFRREVHLEKLIPLITDQA